MILRAHQSRRKERKNAKNNLKNALVLTILVYGIEVLSSIVLILCSIGWRVKFLIILLA